MKSDLTVKAIAFLLALPVGGWMIFDGIHVLTTGRYFGPEKPGLWSDVMIAIGLDPFKFGIPFIAFGVLWLLFLFALLLLRQSWAWYAAMMTAILTLWYLPVGTILSLLYIFLLFMFRTRFNVAHKSADIEKT